MELIEIRKEIAKHLALSDKLERARKEVVEKDLPVEYVAGKYGLECLILCRKKDIIRHKEEFYDRKRKLDVARKEIIEGKFTCDIVSLKHGISLSTLYRELNKARTQENYEYDKKIISNSKDFTYLQEELLLESLKNWKRCESSQSCTCRLCALEQLLTIAYEFAQRNNIERLPYSYKLVHVIWLEDFEMRHSDEISRSFDSVEKCLKQIQADE